MKSEDLERRISEEEMEKILQEKAIKEKFVRIQAEKEYQERTRQRKEALLLEDERKLAQERKNLQANIPFLRD